LEKEKTMLVKALTTFEVEQQFDTLVQAGAYAEALDLITHEAHIFPHHAQKVVYSWRMMLACRLNKPALALQLLEEAMQAGFWYSDLRTDSDYQVLYGMPEFERLADICQEQRARAMAQAVPVVKLLMPQSQQPPYALLLALHGGNSEVESFAAHWSAAVSHGWLVALPQSSQPFEPGKFTWNDWDWSQQEVRERHAALCREYPIDPERVVMAGFSQGGGLATWLVLGGAIQARGLILVGPFLQDPNNLIPVLEKREPDGLRVYLVAGQRDMYCHGIAQQLAKLLPKYGIACKLDDYPDLEHSFPVDFEKKLPEALDFVISA
jgi:predicted esterase